MNVFDTNGVMTVYIDMDGVIALWAKATLEEIRENHDFFRERTPDEFIVKLVQELIRRGVKVYFLTAVLGRVAASAKRWWLDSLGFGDIPMIVVPYGDEKSKYIPEAGILLDDYSVNLHAWKKTGMPCVKYCNGVNGNNGTWKGAAISAENTVNEAIAILLFSHYKYYDFVQQIAKYYHDGYLTKTELENVLHEYAYGYARHTGYDGKKVLYQDALNVVLSENVKQQLKIDEIIDIFTAYVNNDYEGTGDSTYVRYALYASGCTKKLAEEIGLGYVFDDEE